MIVNRIHVLICFFLLLTFNVNAGENFYFPLQKINIDPYGTSWTTYDGTWLGTGDGRGADHIGVDMALITSDGTNITLNEQVVPIADGRVLPKENTWGVTSPSTKGWGANNVGVWVEHRLANKKKYLVLYAHIQKKSAVEPGTNVFAARQFLDGVIKNKNDEYRQYLDILVHFGRSTLQKFSILDSEKE